MPEALSPDWLSWAFWAQAHESIRDLVITLAALVGIPFVVWREWLHHRQTKAALRQAATAEHRHEAQIEADRERRITDNFTRAVEQLGSDKLETRLGSIYALERIARESPTDHWPIMETLTAYVRERAPRPPTERSPAGAPRPETLLVLPGMRGLVQEDLRPPTDIQAVLTVIGRRRREHESAEQTLDLGVTDMRGAFLHRAHLERANLTAAHLGRAFLSEAHLEAAALVHANVQEAFLKGAHLELAALPGARLEGAHLIQAHLNGAHLHDAHLERADLRGAHLEGAHLWHAHFAGAHLEAADLRNTDLTQEQFDSAYTDEDTRVPPHIKRSSRQAGEAAETQHRAATPSGGDHRDQ